MTYSLANHHCLCWVPLRRLKMLNQILDTTPADCTKQERIIGYQPPPYDQTPCYLDEVSCTRQIVRPRFGNTLKLTYEWKHFIYEDYDRQLLNAWEDGSGPEYLFISSGAHDCYHEPGDVERHVRQVERLAQHLGHLKNQTIVWVDVNPATHGVHESALDCVRLVNAAALEQARQQGFYLFSRQSMILSGHQVDEKGDYPMHQPDHIVREQVEVLASWLSCLEEEAEQEEASLQQARLFESS